jgi:hypothetical protein
MWNRCIQPSQPNYLRYGGRGIRVCDRWADYATFLADVGPRPDGKTLDRIDVNGDYTPGNTRWSTPSEQQHNQRPRIFAARPS